MKRFVTGALLVVYLVLMIWLGGWVFAVGAMVAIGLTIFEELRALRVAGHLPVCYTAWLAAIASLPMVMLYSAAMILPVLLLMALLALLTVMIREKPDLTDVMVSVLPMLTLVLPGMCLMGLLDPDTSRAFQTTMLSLVFTVAVLGDTFAFLVGSRVRGPKLCPVVSPNKTISGAIGGLLGSLLGAVAVGLIARAAAPSVALPPLWAFAVLGVVGGAAGELGDLFASMVKRYCGIKDFGSLFPGHGGMLDRMDSILFVSIAVYCFKLLFQIVS